MPRHTLHEDYSEQPIHSHLGTLECHRTAEHMPPTSTHTKPASSPLTTPCRDAIFGRREENTGAVRGVMCDGESKGQTIVNGRSMKTPGEESEVAEMAETVDIMS